MKGWCNDYVDGPSYIHFAIRFAVIMESAILSNLTSPLPAKVIATMIKGDKSEVNKILYALLAKGQVIKSDDKCPLWSLPAPDKRDAEITELKAEVARLRAELATLKESK